MSKSQFSLGQKFNYIYSCSNYHLINISRSPDPTNRRHKYKLILWQWYICLYLIFSTRFVYDKIIETYWKYWLYLNDIAMSASASERAVILIMGVLRAIEIHREHVWSFDINKVDKISKQIYRYVTLTVPVGLSIKLKHRFWNDIAKSVKRPNLSPIIRANYWL